MRFEHATGMGRAILVIGVMVTILGGCAQPTEPPPETDVAEPSLLLPEEIHLRNLRQLTFGGENAEAYFSADGKYLIFQSKRDELECDQIFVMEIDSGAVEMVSNGKGKTTCSFFFPGEDRIVYSSTFQAGDACPPRAPSPFFFRPPPRRLLVPLAAPRAKAAPPASPRSRSRRFARLSTCSTRTARATLTRRS